MQLKRLIEIGIDSRKAKQGGKEVEQAMHGVGDAAGKAKSKIKDVHEELGVLGSTGSKVAGVLKGVFASIAAGFTANAILRAILDLEDQMIELQNSTRLTDEEIKELVHDLGLMSTQLPITSKQLSELAVVAYQMGARGVPQIEKFTDAIARLGLTSDAKGAQAAESIGRILKVSGESVDGVDVLAASIGVLEDAFGASAQKISDATLDIVQQTSGLSVTSKQAAAISAALLGVGVDLGGIGMSVGKTFRTIEESTRKGGESLKLLAMVAGESAEEFKASFERDAGGAYRKFITGLGQFQKQGGNVLEVLNALELGDNRLAKSILPLIKHSDELTRALGEVADGEANVNNLREESERRAKSLGGQLSRGKNILEEVAKKLKPVGDGAARAVGFLNEVALSLLGGREAGHQFGDAVDRTGVALKVVAIALAATIALQAGVYFLGMSVALYKAATGAMALTSASTTFLAVLTAIMAYDLGSYFYNEFASVQKFAAKFIAFFQDGWSDVQLAGQNAWLWIQKVALQAMDAILTKFNSMSSGMTGFLAGAMDVAAPGSGNSIRAVGVAGQAISQGINAEINDIDARMAENVAAAGKAAEENAAVLKVTIDEIDRSFDSSGRATGKSWMQSFGDSLMTDADSILKPAREKMAAALGLTQEGPSPFEELMGPPAPGATDGIGELARSLSDVGKEATGAREKLAEMLDTMRRDADVTLEYASNQNELADARERAQLSADAQKIAEKAWADDVTKQKAAVVELVEALGHLQAARRRAAAIASIEEQHESLEESIRLLGRSRTERQHAADVAKYHAAMEEIYGEKTEEAADATRHFVERLEELDHLTRLQQAADTVGDAWGGMFEEMAFDAKNFEDVIEDVLRNTSRAIFNSMVTQPLQGLASQAAGSFFGLAAGGAAGGFGGAKAKGDAFLDGSVTAFAAGGVVTGPRLFGMSGGRSGLMGEAGPEAILPLRRGADGKLGVASQGGQGQASPPIHVTVAISTPNPDAFRRSQRQVGAAMQGAALRAFRRTS